MRIGAVGLLSCLLAAYSGQEPAMVSTSARLPTLVSDSEPSAARDAWQARLIQISRFDCVVSNEVSDDAEFPWSKGISQWSGGGPGGATWNAGELRCTVEFQTNCAKGYADIELRVGGALSGSERPMISRAGPQQISFRVLAKQWEKNFDQGSPRTKRFPYRTATFSASATVSCKAPEIGGHSIGPRLEFADDQHFTAGFASGE